MRGTAVVQSPSQSDTHVVGSISAATRVRKVGNFNHKLSDHGSQYRASGKGLFKGKGHYRLKGIVKGIKGHVLKWEHPGLQMVYR